MVRESLSGSVCRGWSCGRSPPVLVVSVYTPSSGWLAFPVVSKRMKLALSAVLSRLVVGLRLCLCVSVDTAPLSSHPSVRWLRSFRCLRSGSRGDGESPVSFICNRTQPTSRPPPSFFLSLQNALCSCALCTVIFKQAECGFVHKPPLVRLQAATGSPASGGRLAGEPVADCRRTSAGSSTVRRWFACKPPLVRLQVAGGLLENQRRSVDEPALVRLHPAAGSFTIHQASCSLAIRRRTHQPMIHLCRHRQTKVQVARHGALRQRKRPWQSHSQSPHLVP